MSNTNGLFYRFLRNGTAVSYSKATDPLCPYSENRTENKMEFDMEIVVNASKNDLGSIRTEFSEALQWGLIHKE